MLQVTMATVIVDELLCFISNKIDYVTCDELVALCTKSFTAVNIKESKLTRFNACNRGRVTHPVKRVLSTEIAEEIIAMITMSRI